MRAVVYDHDLGPWVCGLVCAHRFQTMDKFGGRGGTEFAFVSCTTDKGVAMHYSGGVTVFVMQTGAVTRGASLAWLSYYPHEREVLLSPCTALEVTGRPLVTSAGHLEYSLLVVSQSQFRVFSSFILKLMVSFLTFDSHMFHVSTLICFICSTINTANWQTSHPGAQTIEDHIARRKFVAMEVCDVLIKGESTLPMVKDILTNATRVYDKTDPRVFTDDDAFMDSIQGPLECLQIVKVVTPLSGSSIYCVHMVTLNHGMAV